MDQASSDVGSGDWIRTGDTSGMNRMLWPTELRRHISNGIIQKNPLAVNIFPDPRAPKGRPVILAGEEGFEPSAYGFGDRRSTS